LPSKEEFFILIHATHSPSELAVLALLSALMHAFHLVLHHIELLLCLYSLVNIPLGLCPQRDQLVLELFLLSLHVVLQPLQLIIEILL